MTEQLKNLTEKHCENPPSSYTDLKVLFLNCTLNRTPVLSHTEGLIKIAQNIFEKNGVSTKIIRPVDYEIPAGLGLDMSRTPEWDPLYFGLVGRKIIGMQPDPGKDVWLYPSIQYQRTISGLWKGRCYFDYGK